jgi:predicted metal-binding transcription factor (methanogenesis marker protein 9)
MDKDTIRESILCALRDGDLSFIDNVHSEFMLFQKQVEEEILSLLQIHNELGLHAKHHGVPCRYSLKLCLIESSEYHLEQQYR